MFRTAKLSMSHGFTKGVCVDALYLKNDVLEYSPPYVQSNFTCNPDPTDIFTSPT